LTASKWGWPLNTGWFKLDYHMVKQADLKEPCGNKAAALKARRVDE